MRLMNSNEGRRLTCPSYRTFPYRKLLPYATEGQAECESHFDHCLEWLELSILAKDLASGAVLWANEISKLLDLKFDLSRERRTELARLFYSLALTPGMPCETAKVFAAIFERLLRGKHKIRPGSNFILDWRPLYKQLSLYVTVPWKSKPSMEAFDGERNFNLPMLISICTIAQPYFEHGQRHAILEEFIPYSHPRALFSVIGYLNLFLPTSPPTGDFQAYLPTLFHLWSKKNMSAQSDERFLDLFSRLAEGALMDETVLLTAYGIFSKYQAVTIYTTILRALQIQLWPDPVSQEEENDDGLDRGGSSGGSRAHMAWLIIMSLSPACLVEDSILTRLEDLMRTLKPFAHPSDSDPWLIELVTHLAHFFVMRWNREHTGQLELSDDRKLNDELKHRFVLCLRDVALMGIYSEDQYEQENSVTTLQHLAYLQPELILSHALYDIYGSMSSSNEVHRTITSFRCLRRLAKVITRTKRYRCHIMPLLGFALQGIDVNDPDKTVYALSFVEVVAHSVPFFDLTNEKQTHENGSFDHAKNPGNRPDVNSKDSLLVQSWFNQHLNCVQRRDGVADFSDISQPNNEDEQAVLLSSTMGMADFMSAFLDRVFALLEHIDSSKDDSPKRRVVSQLSQTFRSLLGSLSSELYDLALDKISRYVLDPVAYEAHEVMASICNVLVKIEPQKALQRLLPQLVERIKFEIELDKTRTPRAVRFEVRPEQRALVRNIDILGMCLANVGATVLQFREDLLAMTGFMYEHCCSRSMVLPISRCMRRLLLGLTSTYTLDFRMCESQNTDTGVTSDDWGGYCDPQTLDIVWHVPNDEEINFALLLLEKQSHSVRCALQGLSSKHPTQERGSARKVWSDNVLCNLILLQHLISGASALIDPRYSDHGGLDKDNAENTVEDRCVWCKSMSPEDDVVETLYQDLAMGDVEIDGSNARRLLLYPTGYPLQRNSEAYNQVHAIRTSIGDTLHSIHELLVDGQEDHVECSRALYEAYRAWFVDVGRQRSVVEPYLVGTRITEEEARSHKFDGIRKDYPRRLLVRLADTYHLRRLEVQHVPRTRRELEVKLLLDLAKSSLSDNNEIGLAAQKAMASALPRVKRGRSIVLPSILDNVEAAIETSDTSIAEGGMRLLFGAVGENCMNDWRYAPRLFKIMVQALKLGRRSITDVLDSVMERALHYERPSGRMISSREDMAEMIKSTAKYKNCGDSIHDDITQYHNLIHRRKLSVEEKKTDLCRELVRSISGGLSRTQTKYAIAIAMFLTTGLDDLPPLELFDVVARHASDTDLGLRGFCNYNLCILFDLLKTRNACNHDYRNLPSVLETPPGQFHMRINPHDSEFTRKHLDNFAIACTEVYIDHEHPGWLVWKDSIPAFPADSTSFAWDNVEAQVVHRLGAIINREWFARMFRYMPDESLRTYMTDEPFSRHRSLIHAFSLVISGTASASFEDIKGVIQNEYGDMSHNDQHRAMAEVMSSLVICSSHFDRKKHAEVWDFALPIIKDVFQYRLGRENLPYWEKFLRTLLRGRDPRRAWPLIKWLADFRLDMASDSVFRDKARIDLLHQVIAETGWHFRLQRPILEDFVQHLDYRYEDVRQAMGRVLAAIYRNGCHESHSNLDALLQAQKSAGPVGGKPYEPTEDFKAMFDAILARLEGWRLQGRASQETWKSYMRACKTVFHMLLAILSSRECSMLNYLQQDSLLLLLQHSMDVTEEDNDLSNLATHIFINLASIPQRIGELNGQLDALIHISSNSENWHHRKNFVEQLELACFRDLFIVEPAQQHCLFKLIYGMLDDQETNVRHSASKALVTMVCCLRVNQYSPTVDALHLSLIQNLKSRSNRWQHRDIRDMSRATCVEHGLRALVSERDLAPLSEHAAVLGLGALIHEAAQSDTWPYWMPSTVTIIAERSEKTDLPGREAKRIVIDFREMYRDEWKDVRKVRFSIPKCPLLKGSGPLYCTKYACAN